MLTCTPDDCLVELRRTPAAHCGAPGQGEKVVIPSISIIVPTYREAENLPLLVSKVASALAGRSWAWEMIVVDDDSPDGTGAVLAELSARFPQVRGVVRKNQRGLSSAVLAGIELSSHDFVVVMDADLSHPPEKIPELVEKLMRGEADFVIGSRHIAGGKTEDWTAFRWLNSAVATLLAKPLAGAVRDPMAGFFALRRDTLAHADVLNPIGYKIGLELIVKAHVPPHRVAEVPITFRNRAHGESKLTLAEQFRYLEHLSRLYDYRYPKGSPRAKFLVAAGCGAAACYGALAALDRPMMPSLFSMAVAFLAMIGVTLAFFWRYVRAQRDFIVMKSPYTEFAVISFAEFIAAWAFAIATQANVYMQAAVGIVILLLVRYTLRKVFLHDLRGVRGTANAAGNFRLTLSPRRESAASA